MARKSNKDVNDIEVKTEEVTMPKKKAIPTKEYTIKNRVKVRGKWLERGAKISLTEKGFKFFLSKKYI